MVKTMKIKSGGGCSVKKTMKGGAKKPMKGGAKKPMKGGDGGMGGPGMPKMDVAGAPPAPPAMPAAPAMATIPTPQGPPAMPAMPTMSPSSSMASMAAPPAAPVPGMPVPTLGPQTGGAKKSKKGKGASGVVMGWCMKCKMMHEMKDPVQFTSKKGRKAIFMKGTCAKTGTKMSAIVGN
jgi:hypothetical protein